MKSKLSLTILTFLFIAMPVNALDRISTASHIRENVVKELFDNNITADLAQRDAKRRLCLLKKELLLDDIRHWSDGRYAVVTAFDAASRQVELYYENVYEPDVDILPSHMLKVRGGKVTTAQAPRLRVTVEQYGNYKMLVYRNAKREPVYAFYSMNNEQIAEHNQEIFIYYLLAGNYRLQGGENSIFGVRQDFYQCSEYNRDPGIFSYYVYPDFSSIDIIYGNGRVSHGDPSSPKYGKMPGGGGAGALMGPMRWNVKFTCQGLEVKVVDDEPFVDHNPRLDNKGLNVLDKVQGPWQGVDGKWPFASVIPLTHQLLKLFPKDVLKLMRAEIVARHGGSFDDADLQQYFNRQPWYKRSSKAEFLTDIEQFNDALIKQALSAKK